MGIPSTRSAPTTRRRGDVRIVSLVPSVTELLWLGLAPHLVGRTGFCIHPREVVRSIPKIGGTKDVDVDRIRELAPTHLVVNIDENRKETVEELARFVPSVVVTHPLAPEDNLGLYRLLGGIFGRSAEAERLCEDFAAAYAALLARPRPGRAVPDLARAVDDSIARRTSRARSRSSAGRPSRRARTGATEVDPAAVAGGVERVLLSASPTVSARSISPRSRRSFPARA
jgi:hypothetical protein